MSAKRLTIFSHMLHVVKSVHIPVAVKIGPFFSSIPNMVRRFDEGGAKGVVLFNRFYQPDFDLQTLEVVPDLVLSNSSELLMRLHWVAIWRSLAAFTRRSTC